MDSKLYTVSEIAQMFSMHPKTIRRYIQRGSLPARKIGKEWRILENDLKAFLDSNVEFHKDHLESALESVNEFIHGGSSEQTGKDKVLTIADVFIETKDEVKDLCDALLEVIKAKQDDGVEAQFKFFYIEESKKARFILSGSPKYIGDMLKVLEK